MRHILGGTWLDGRRLYRQRPDILVHCSDHFAGELADRDRPFHRTLDDFVVNIGDVAHVAHLHAAGLEPALHHVESHHHPRVPDVAQVVDRHAADIHAHMARDDR